MDRKVFAYLLFLLKISYSSSLQKLDTFVSFTYTQSSTQLSTPSSTFSFSSDAFCILFHPLHPFFCTGDIPSSPHPQIAALHILCTDRSDRSFLPLTFEHKLIVAICLEDTQNMPSEVRGKEKNFSAVSDKEEDKTLIERQKAVRREYACKERKFVLTLQFFILILI